jgi:hypothetical protein
MIATKEERFRSKITGRVYDIKRTVDQMVVLETPDSTNQIVTELNNLSVFYERELNKDEDQE